MSVLFGLLSFNIEASKIGIHSYVKKVIKFIIEIKISSVYNNAS